MDHMIYKMKRYPTAAYNKSEPEVKLRYFTTLYVLKAPSYQLEIKMMRNTQKDVFFYCEIIKQFECAIFMQ